MITNAASTRTVLKTPRTSLPARNITNQMDLKVAQFALDVLKLAPRYLVALALIAAVFLFSPESFLKKIGRDQLANNYRPWFGGAFIVFTIPWLVARSAV